MGLSFEEKRNILGLNITYYRRAKKMTQLQLAEKICVSGNYLSQVERGFKTVSLTTLAQISEILGVDESDLLNFSKQKNQ